MKIALFCSQKTTVCVKLKFGVQVHMPFWILYVPSLKPNYQLPPKLFAEIQIAQTAEIAKCNIKLLAKKKTLKVHPWFAGI